MGLSGFALGTAALTGTLEQKLHAVVAAGFPAIVLGAKDLVGHPRGVAAAARAVRKSGLRVSALVELRDFEGLPPAELEYKLEIARSLLEMSLGVRSDLLVVASSTVAHASSDRQRIAQDLATLGTLATPLKLRIGYRALPEGRWIKDVAAAAEVVARTGRENVGLVIDACDLLASAVESIAAVSAGRIFLAQLSGRNGELDGAGEAGARRRLFPGEGANAEAVVELVRTLRGAGYVGAFSLDAASDEYEHSLPGAVADRARRSAEWITEQLRDPG